MGLIKEFKDFAVRGNVIDLAVGVVIGGAFGKIVTSLVNDLIMPLVGKLTGGVDLADRVLVLEREVTNAQGVVTKPAVELRYGAFINSVTDFIIVAIAIFIAVKMINTARARFEKKQEKPVAKPAEDVLLLREIRDALVKR